MLLLEPHKYAHSTMGMVFPDVKGGNTHKVQHKGQGKWQHERTKPLGGCQQGVGEGGH
jgi:hypothetical protein